MGIIVNLDVMMVKRKIFFLELVEKVGIINVNLFILKNNKVKVIRFFIFEVICRELQC